MIKYQMLNRPSREGCSTSPISGMSLPFVLFSLLLALTNAQTCPPGMFPRKGECVDCQPGSWSYANSTACTKCDPGTFNPFPGAQGPDLCRRCLTGTFSRAGASICKPCPVGTVSEDVSKRCYSCGPGTELRFNRCVQCWKGGFSSEEGNLDCTGCPSGMTTLSRGATSMSQCVPKSPPRCAAPTFKRCGNCDAGSFFNVRTLNCEPCPPGSFSRRRGKKECTPCPIGNFSLGFFADRCFRCPSGTSADVIGTSVCKIEGAPCPSTHFEDSEGRCRTCERGFRQDARTKTCVACPERSWSLGGRGISCFTCPPGKTLSTGLGACLCNAGTVEQSDGSCKKCPPGTQRDSLENAPICSACDRNSFSNTSGTVKCSACPLDQYQPKSGQTTCIACPSGTIRRRFGPFPGCVSTRTNCPPGYKRKRNGFSFKCERDVCPPGTFKQVDFRGIEMCRGCFPGQRLEVRADGTRQCVACGEKEISEGGDVTTCTTCPKGMFRYRPEGNRCVCLESGYRLQGGICKKCPPGTFSRYFSPRCIPCAVGHFARGFGNFISCRRCPKNTFSDKRGAASCKACPSGTVSYGLGEDQCVSVSSTFT